MNAEFTVKFGSWMTFLWAGNFPLLSKPVPLWEGAPLYSSEIRVKSKRRGLYYSKVIIAPTSRSIEDLSGGCGTVIMCKCGRLPSESVIHAHAVVAAAQACLLDILTPEELQGVVREVNKRKDIGGFAA